MMTHLKKAVLTAAFVSLAPVAPLLIGSASDADAHTYVSGSITVGSPVAVVGFSYGNPFPFGHVHYAPGYCDVGPLYYYPAYHVYAHYYPRVHYDTYARPRYYYPQHHYYRPGPPRYIRGRAYGHYDRRYGVRGHDHDDEDD